MLDFCSMSEESMSKINPQTILDSLQAAEDDAKKVEKKFMEKMNTYEDVNVSNFLNAPEPGLLKVLLWLFRIFMMCLVVYDLFYNHKAVYSCISLIYFLIFHHFWYSFVFKVKGFHIKPGSNKPGESIIGTANREKCDLIIMGTRGLDDEKRLILGSVSDYIVHHSWIPTMVCPKASPKL